MSTNKRVFLITGANSGIGYETAFALANASASHHVIMAARSASRGQIALEELRARKPEGTLSLQLLDLASDDSIFSAIKSIEDDFGKLDVLINNAAIADSARLGESERPIVSREEMRRIFETNVYGTFILTQASEPLLRNATYPARIINISTGLGSIGLRADHGHSSAAVNYETYRMSKAALNMMTMSFRYHLREWAIVHAYEPGLTVSNLTGPEDQEVRKALNADTPEDVAAEILKVVDGKRDEETGALVTKEAIGIWPW